MAVLESDARDDAGCGHCDGVVDGFEVKEKRFDF